MLSSYSFGHGAHKWAYWKLVEQRKGLDRVRSVQLPEIFQQGLRITGDVKDVVEALCAQPLRCTLHKALRALDTVYVAREPRQEGRDIPTARPHLEDLVGGPQA